LVEFQKKIKELEEKKIIIPGMVFPRDPLKFRKN